MVCDRSDHTERARRTVSADPREGLERGAGDPHVVDRGGTESRPQRQESNAMENIGNEIPYRRANDPRRTGSLVLDQHRDEAVREMRAEAQKDPKKAR